MLLLFDCDCLLFRIVFPTCFWSVFFRLPCVVIAVHTQIQTLNEAQHTTACTSKLARTLSSYSLSKQISYPAQESRAAGASRLHRSVANASLADLRARRGSRARPLRIYSQRPSIFQRCRRKAQLHMPGLRWRVLVCLFLLFSRVFVFFRSCVIRSVQVYRRGQDRSHDNFWFSHNVFSQFGHTSRRNRIGT